jgi:hypothetical protein
MKVPYSAVAVGIAIAVGLISIPIAIPIPTVGIRMDSIDRSPEV